VSRGARATRRQARRGSRYLVFVLGVVVSAGGVVVVDGGVVVGGVVGGTVDGTVDGEADGARSAGRSPTRSVLDSEHAVRRPALRVSAQRPVSSFFIGYLLCVGVANAQTPLNGCNRHAAVLTGSRTTITNAGDPQGG
jgi:hypothetical protein